MGFFGKVFYGQILFASFHVSGNTRLAGRYFFCTIRAIESDMVVMVMTNSSKLSNLIFFVQSLS